MAFDPALAEALRAALADVDDVTEKAMFGSRSFMVGGKLRIGANSQGGLFLKARPERLSDLLDLPGVEPMLMRGRPMSVGWITVDRSALTTDADLAFWLDEALPA